MWAGMPLAIQLAVLAIVGAMAGGLANCIVFACANVVTLTNPWAPVEPDAPPRNGLDRLPIIGWLRLRREVPERGRGFWLGPCLLEICAAVALPVFYWFQIQGDGIFLEAIQFWIWLPIGIRYALLVVIGLCAGAAANYLIYSQAHQPRPIDPWSPPAEQAPSRQATDRIPILGWFGLRRESPLHGRGFWVRPVLIEVGLAIAFPLFYWYVTQSGGLLPEAAANPGFLARYEPIATQIFGGHAILLFLMTAATFIDIDEKTIPDIITIPGTLIALLLGAVTLDGFLPTSLPVGGVVTNLHPTTFDSPWFQPAKWFTPQGLWTGLAIWSGWCFALADRRFSGVMLRRRGLAKTIGFFFAALFHHWTWKLLVALWIAGAVFITVLWNIGGTHWQGLFTALVGMAAGGGTIWAIRIVASWAMNMEAMGFGDVTLMAMIGAMIGWQGAVAAFFVSPFAAIAIVLIQYIITKDSHVPFGPYLCAGTAWTVVFWDSIFNQWLAFNILTLWGMLQWLMLALLGLMAVMLFVLRVLKSLAFRGED